MASFQMDSSHESHCVLCCEDIDFSACGLCDHPICLKCCVKLRLLRKENDCPVCRTELKEVIVSKGYKSWTEKMPKPRGLQRLRTFGIYHRSRESQSKVEELLQHSCPKCGEIFKTFPCVKDHVRKKHVCYYCDICVRHLKIFTHERKCYTREDLVRHRKTGDPDDKSHRGHPLCHFCDERYLDNDELLIHLRKNHFWCHLCEKDGCQDYFATYKDLRNHFRESHFLCEEGNCLHEKFTCVFRTKIDYQAHKAQKHSDKLSKAAARQVRQLDVDIRYTPRQADSAGVVSARDYSFPDQRSDRYGGRRTENRERAAGLPSSDREDSLLRDGSDESRHVRQKRRNVNTNRKPRNSKQEKMVVDSQKDMNDQKSFTDKMHRAGSLDTGLVVGGSSGLENGNRTKAEKVTEGIKSGQSDSDQASRGKLPSSESKTKTKKYQNDFSESCPSNSEQELSNSIAHPQNYDQQYPKLSDNGTKTVASLHVPKRTYHEEFPTLSSACNGHNKSSLTTKAPPGLPSPGFLSTGQPPSRPPPGLGWAAPPSLAAPSSAAHRTQHNIGRCIDRNQRLIADIQRMLNHRGQSFQRFREVSGQFRNGSRSAESYYEECCGLLGEDNIRKVFRRLIDSLPNEQKQKELLSVYNDAKILAQQAKANNPVTDWSSSQNPHKNDLVLSEQVALQEGDFPALPKSGKKTVKSQQKVKSGAWLHGQ